MNLQVLRGKLRTRIQGNPLLLALSHLAGDSVVYLIGAALVGLGNFILVPLYTRNLSPAEFGIYSLLEVTILILVLISQLGMTVTYLKYSAEYGISRRGELLGTSLLLGGGSSLVLGILFALFLSGPIGTNWLRTDVGHLSWILLIIVGLETLQNLFLSDLRAHRRPTSYSFVAVSRLLAIVGSSIYFIVILKQGVKGIFLGRMFGDSAGVLLLMFLCLPKARLRFSRTIVKPIVSYGLPLVWSAFMAMMLDATGRFFLNRFSTLEEVGYYGAAIKISSIIQIIIAQPFGIAWGGLMFQIVKWPGARVIYSKILAYMVALSLLVSLILAAFTPTLFSVFATADYSPAMAIFPLILIARALNILEHPTSIGLYLGEKTKWFAFIYSIGLGINVVLNFLLVPAYGMIGAAFAWLFAWLIITGFMGLSGQKYYPLSYDWQFFVFPVGAWALFGIITLALPSNANLPLLKYGLALLSTLWIAVLIMKDISRNRNKPIHEGSERIV